MNSEHSIVYFQVFDATNSTAERRKMIHDIVVDKWGYKLFFVESICDDPLIIEQNIMVINLSCLIYAPSFLFKSFKNFRMFST